MSTGPDHAFILAAGFGKRLQPHTLDNPKPLVKVGKTTLLDHTLDHLIANNVKKTVINTHYLAEKIENKVKNRQKPEIILSYEPEILETGGGIKKALAHFNGQPFFVLSGDGYWHNPPNGPPSLQALANAWNPDIMDILILLQPVRSMAVTKGVGDYDLGADGKATRSLNQTGAYMFTSMRINHPRIFDGTPDTPFSYLQLLDKAQAQGRLYGLVHDGIWHHISTPQDLEAVRKAESHG